jgi:predicted PurR-regulated permease PerM
MDPTDEVPRGDERPPLVTIPRWLQLAVIPALLLTAWFVLGLIGEAVFIFLVAGLIALVLNPLVRALERIHVPRYVGVFVVYLFVVAVIVGLAALIIPPLVGQARNLADAAPGMVDGAQTGIDEVQRLADRFNVEVDVRQKVEDLATSLDRLVPTISERVYGVGRSIVATVTVGFIIIVVSIYMLLDSRRLSRALIDHFPTGSRTDGEEYVRISQGAVVNYVKAQVLLSAALGASAGLAMYILGVTGVFERGDDYALFFGAWTAVMEFIPYLGPVLAAVPPSIVALFQSPLTMVWVILTFLGIQQIEGHILTPTIMGQRFRVHPLIVIFAILAGNEIHGVMGMFMAIPLIPLVKETIVFMRPRLRFEGWSALRTPGRAPEAPTTGEASPTPAHGDDPETPTRD